MIDFSKYLGKDYEEFDCWELAILFYREEFDLDLSYIFDGEGPVDPEEREILIQTNKGHFEEVKHPCVGDLVVIRFRGLENHIGIYAGTNRFLHSLEGVGSVLDNLRRYEKMIVGYYRSRSLND